MAFTRIRLWLRSFVQSETRPEGRERVRRIRPKIEVLEERVTPASILVTSATDDGTGKAGTLSAAINTANANPGSTIVFNINNNTQGTQQTITVTGVGEPAITQPVTINGFSQGGINAGGVWIELNGAGVNAGVNGLTVNSGGVTIYGLAIDQFSGNGIVLNNPLGSAGDCIFEDFIGTDTSGIKAGLGNGQNGIQISGANNTIGNTGALVPGQLDTLISGNAGAGVYLTGINARGNMVVNSLIGTDATGLASLGGQGTGGVVLDQGASNNTVGVAAVNAMLGNVISGNSNSGVYLYGANSNQIMNDDIGIGPDGKTIVRNGGDGVSLLNGSSNNTIGGYNVISGNAGDGVRLSGPNITGNKIQGNHIGTSENGQTAEPNQRNGVRIDSTSANTVGGNNAGQGNVISGNNSNGVQISGAGANNNLVTGNYIGTDYTGTLPIANGRDGIYLY